MLVGHFYSDLSFLSPSLWETARYRLKYCLKGPLNPLPTNQPTVDLDPFTGVKINHCSIICMTNALRGWSGGAMVLGKLPVPGRPTIWITVGQGPTALTVGAGGEMLWAFLFSSILSLLFLPLFGRRPDID